MARSTTQISLQALLDQSTVPAEQKAVLVTRLNDLALEPLEEFLLTSLHKPSVDTLAADLEIYEGWIQLVDNGMTNATEVWKVEEDVPKEFTKELLEDPDFIGKVFASLYRWYKKGIWDYSSAVLAFSQGLSDFTSGSFLFSGLAPEWQLFYNRVTALVFVEYFEVLPQAYELVFLNSHLVVVAAQLGLGIDQALADDIDHMVALDSRQELNTSYAAFLATSTAELGGKPVGDHATIAWWITTFNEKYPAGDPRDNLKKFLEEKMFDNCSADEKTVVVRILELYSKLTSGEFVLTAGDIEAAKKKRAELDKQKGSPTPVSNEEPTETISDRAVPKLPSYAEVKKQIEAEFEHNADGQFARPDLVINKLMELALKYQEDLYAELYYLDEQKGDFEWNEKLLKK